MHLLRLVLALCLASFSPVTAHCQSATRPNVLLLFMDDQQADTIAALGNSPIQSPHLDQLVNRGLAFDRAYMMGGMNGATCIPSRAMLLAGQTLFRIDEKLLRDETWPAAFKKAGYRTFLTGKWHNGPTSISRSFSEARSVFVGGMTNPVQAPLSHLEAGKLTKPEVSSQHACAQFADEAIAFLKQEQAKPFFCYVAFDGPHDPHIVPAVYPLNYDPAKLPVPKNFLPQHPFNNGDMTLRDEKLLPWPRTPEHIQKMLAEYYRYISYLDEQVGRILAALEASPHARNTIIVFAADSGVARGQHGLIGKQNCYEHSLRVPLILAGPGIPANQRTKAMCYLSDVLPTLGELCQVQRPTASDGQSFASVLLDPSRSARSQLVFGYRQVQRAIRDERWKLIRYPQVNVTQLFDLQNDPWEINNLAEQPEQANRVRDMLFTLGKELQSLGDTLPLTVANPQPPAWSPP